MNSKQGSETMTTETITVAWRNDEGQTFERTEADPLRARQLVRAIREVENLTQIMTRDELRTWMTDRGSPAGHDTERAVERHYGRTEDEMDAEYDRICGSMA